MKVSAIGAGSILGVGLLVMGLGEKVHAGGCGCGSKSADLVDTAVSAGNFRTLVTAVKAAGLVETLKGEGPFTVFAPTDKAFAKLPADKLNALLNNKEQLKAVLLYHVVPGKVMAKDVVKLSSAKTALGQELNIKSCSGVHVNEATVVKADVKASNGVIHVIDSVLLPKNDLIEVARAAGSFKTLLTALEAADLTAALRSEGPFTVFAPTDEAFGNLPEGTVDSLLKDIPKLKSILTYHVVPGKALAADVVQMDWAKTLQGQSVKVSTAGGVKVDNARVLQTDILAWNGVIHVIDAVILPTQGGTRMGSR